MEAVPKLPLISFKLKTSAEGTHFGPKLKQVSGWCNIYNLVAIKTKCSSLFSWLIDCFSTYRMPTRKILRAIVMRFINWKACGRPP